MKYTTTDLKAILAGLNAIDPHNIFVSQLKSKIIAELKEAEQEKK